MAGTASDLARRLAAEGEAFCRHYLPGGRREGGYWVVGDLFGSPGRSLYVRLTHSADRRAGKWTDAATGEHGDLLDLLTRQNSHGDPRGALLEARRFLALPSECPAKSPARKTPKCRPSRQAARRLFQASLPIAGTAAEAYLERRGIADAAKERWLRFHPRCWYRPASDDPPDLLQAFPALIAAITDEAGSILGVHRTWLDSDGSDKAPVATPRRAMGHLLGAGVRFGTAGHVLVAGEGLETILSLREALPNQPMIACLSAAHLGALMVPSTVKRLYVARDRDPAGDQAFARLEVGGASNGISVRPLWPPAGSDFNDALLALGLEHLREDVRRQAEPDDRHLF